MFENIDALMKEIEELKEARELLEDIWMEVGPYGHKEISQKIIYKIQGYFKFDDSE